MKTFLLVCSGVLAVAVCYFSWVPEPSFKQLSWFPRWLARWTDRNDNVRTAVPMLLLGLAGGWMLYLQAAGVRGWLKAWGGMVGMVGLVELGQFFLPHRHCDWRDVLWGAAGAGLGMLPWWGALWISCRSFSSSGLKKKDSEDMI